MWVHVIVLKINTVIQEADESLHSGFNCSSSWEVAWESLHVVYKWHQSKHKVWREAEQKHIYKMMSQQLHTPTLHLLWSLHLSTRSTSQPFLFFLSHCPSIYFLKNVFLPPTMSYKDGGMRSVSLEEEKSYENIIVKWQWHLGKERKLKKVLGEMSQPLQANGSFVKSSSSFLLCSLVVVSWLPTIFLMKQSGSWNRWSLRTFSISARLVMNRELSKLESTFPRRRSFTW